MSQEPSWLTPESSSGAAAAPAPAPSAPDTFAVNTSTTTTNDFAGGADTSTTSPAMDDELQGTILTMRVANMAVSVALVTCSILLMMSFPSISNWVLSIYATIGGLLICCLETQLKFVRVMIAINFGFLFDPVWRFLYYILMASVVWAYDTLFGKIVAGCLIGVSFYNAYVLVKFPAYRKIREQYAQEEDKRIEARISKEVKKQAMGQMTK
mmetsp:Transcript_386/g.520  ORF Transcript_386/g.520 Transcript_386/m.520 type:complete len:211 (+) Transcript_386:106-738(+)|eukprot:CAMPEP_0195262652 /NCGR_PEP_ID=MMETSP0706-20130129/9870_1 /TAXON_ID=33640 /ORGANISM="Asterionellopsis glacialis, Strain CCMP134" /LENGTH=210 /DNA_ID=CAMNT_0040316749 /DNA_START=96 /DNA_END=728 /DNA_ORIENTATION=-